MTCRVLITRSQPGADATAMQVEKRGWLPIVEPLFSIEAIDADLPAFDALAFTSANGVREFTKLSERLDVPVWCVGGRTAQIALDQGFGKVRSANGDVQALISMLKRELKPDVRLLHSGNADSLGDLSENLRAAGFRAEFVATYQAVPVDFAGEALKKHLSGSAAFDAVLIHSPRAAEILASFAEVAAARCPLNIAAISQQSVLKISSLAQEIEIAEETNEAALMEALERLFSRA